METATATRLPRRPAPSAPILIVLLACSGFAQAEHSGHRVVASILPALAYGGACSSTIQVRNLSDIPVAIELEGHRASGALAPLTGMPNRVVHLDPGQQGAYQLEIDEETTSAWVQMRETISDAGRAPAVALSGTTECRDGDQLRVASREVAFPMRNPWFSAEAAGLRGAVVSLINTTASAARASACYSAGNLYSVPDARQSGAEFHELCAATDDVLIPPFATREFPVERGGNTRFSLRTAGEAIVLQMLRSPGEGVRIFSVDSTIQFGHEVPDSGRTER